MIQSRHDPDWSALVQSWKAQQRQLCGQLKMQPLRPLPRFVAGADAAFSTDKQTVFAAAVVYDCQEGAIIEQATASRTAEFPYVPGFLSFREGPAVLDAIAKLRQGFGAVCFDGQGYAHPRRCGIAAHLSILLDMPGVGVAKSRLIGVFEPPAAAAGSYTPLMDGPEQVGIVLRTRDNTRPLFISVGQKMDLESARLLVLACRGRCRIPEPTRQADIEVGRLKRQALA